MRESVKRLGILSIADDVSGVLIQNHANNCGDIQKGFATAPTTAKAGQTGSARHYANILIVVEQTALFTVVYHAAARGLQ